MLLAVRRCWMLRVGTAAALVALATGCRYTREAPFARVHHGPAHRHSVDPLAALPVECTGGPFLGSDYRRAIASATRMGLELAGHDVVDAELLNAETRRRSESNDSKASIRFEELLPDQQRALLEAIGVRGVLRTSLHLGPTKGPHLDQDVTVSVAVHRVGDDALAWRSVCTATGGPGLRLVAAIEDATRCALEAKELW